MFICERNSANAITYQPLSPFSGNFLKEVTDFDKIVESESDSSEIGVRETGDEEDFFDEDCPNGKCPRFVDYDQENGNDETEEDLVDSDIKNRLGRIGNVFVNKYFDDGDQQNRYVRGSTTDEDEGGQKGDAEEKQEEIDDPEFLEETSQVQNVTNATKQMYDELENSPVNVEPEEEQCCPDEDQPNGKVGKEVALVEDSLKKGPKDILEMHFYKYLPDAGGGVSDRTTEVSPPRKKSVLVSMYPEKHKDHFFKTPEKYEYIALLSKDNNLVKIPAVQFTVIPSEGSNRKKRSDNFESFFISKYKRQSPYLRFEPTDNLYQIVNNMNPEYSDWSHVPILFINTIPDMQRKFDNRLFKRSSNFDVSDNQYLRQADLLIQNVNTSLKMGLTEPKQFQVDAGVLFNPKYSNNLNRLRSNEKKGFKKEINKQSAPITAQNKVVSLNNKLDQSGVNDVPVSPMKDTDLIKNDISPMEAGSYKDSSFSKSGLNSFDLGTNLQEDNLMNNDLGSAALVPNKYDSLTRNGLGPGNGGLSNYNTLYQSDINSLESGLSKDNGLIKSDSNSGEDAQSKSDDLEKNEISPINFEGTNVNAPFKNQMGSMEIGSNIDNNLIKNDVNPAQAGSNTGDSLIKNEIDLMEVDQNKGSSLISDTESGLSEDKSLVKNAINPMEISPRRGSSLVKNVVGQMEVAPNKVMSLTKNAITPEKAIDSVKVDTSNKGNNLVRKAVNSAQVSSNKAVSNKHSNEIASTDLESTGNEDNGAVNSNQSNQEGESVTNKNDLSNSLIKNEINPVIESGSNDNTNLENSADVKVNGLAENAFGSNSESGQSGNLIDSRIGEAPGNAADKNDLMPNAYLVDLIKNVNMLKKTDSNLKLIEETTNAEFGFAAQSSEDLAFKATEPPGLGLQQNLNVASDVPNVDLAHLNGPASFTFAATSAAVQNNIATDSSIGRIGSNSPQTQIPLLEMNKTQSIETSLTGNLSLLNGTSSNETNVYEDDDNDIGNILDLLANNMTTVPASSHSSGKKENLSTSSNAVKQASTSSGSSVPTISGHTGKSTSVTASVSSQKGSCKASTGHSTTTEAGLIAKGKSALIDKLHNLQKDLKLVFEVQNILSGAKKPEDNNKRSKRETLRISRGLKKNKSKKKLNKIEEVQALGKILEWKANRGEIVPALKKTKRFLFRLKKRKKKKRRKKKRKKKKKKKKWWKRVFGKPATQRHFLGTDIQNFL